MEEKINSSSEIPTRFDHTKEPDIYASWEKSGAFKPSGTGEPFSIVIPPPNITGDLHMGHALTYGIQDTVARHQRRIGKDVLVLPGMDHAAIAVHALVEKKIQKEQGVNRFQLGREKFLEEVWTWIKYYMPRVETSLKRLGLSADWSRFRFTMDEHSQLAVRTAFVQLYEKGLIYRGEYMVNWDPKLQTAIADDELVHEDRPGQLYWIKYGPLTVATTRPETMFADVAVAVSPKDKRFAKYVGQEIEMTLPTGQTKKLPVIADDFVDPEFGTGAVKITPAHDRDDFDAGKRHNLPTISVIDKYGKLTDLAGEWAGLKTAEARPGVVAKLTELGLVEKVTDHIARVPLSERSGAVIEPLISTQWFMKTTAIKDEALKAVKSGAIKFTPKNMEKLYFHWLKNLHDWCISRQLWWGHEIPAWYDETGKVYVAESIEAAQKQAGDKKLTSDPDVLDTWFSSGLWPFSTLGWPLDSARGKPTDESDFNRYFPTSFLETAPEIIFFWVAKMIMLSQALTGQIPFKQVYFHGFVLDEKGQKMSKSKGNVMDPMVLIDKYGSDALRMSLIGGNTAGTPQRYSEQKIIKYRNFATKVWNASRFVAEATASSQSLLATSQNPNTKSQKPVASSQLPPSLDHTEEEFFKALDKLEQKNQKNFAALKLSLALEELYEFFWHDFADQFLEYEKKVLQESSDQARIDQAKSCLLIALQRQLSLLSDFAPFVTDEIGRSMLG